MTREEASQLVVALFKAHNAEHPGINQQGFAAGMFGAAELYFNYQGQNGNLDCMALIYRFRNTPKDKVLTSLKQAANEYDVNDGELEYLQDSRSLVLKRTYSTIIPENHFVNDMKRLTEASLFWAGEVVERVAAKAFPGSADGSSAMSV